LGDSSESMNICMHPKHPWGLRNVVIKSRTILIEFSQHLALVEFVLIGLAED